MTNPGKTALVTGASRGIGRASTLALAGAGAQVLVHYGRGAAEAEGVINEIRKLGGRADAIAADLAAPDGAHKLAKQVRTIVAVAVPRRAAAVVDGEGGTVGEDSNDQHLVRGGYGQRQIFDFETSSNRATRPIGKDRAKGTWFV